MTPPKTPDDNLIDNGGRRKDSERRNFEYTAHIPERRSGEDRREREERRAKKRKVDNDNKKQPTQENPE
jgi:hypothetical protein